MTADIDPAKRPWWKDAVVYQIYPRSFSDASGDGVGDLAGIRAHLDHLAWLGVDAVWLSPFFRSPMADYGYDVSDYCDVDPLFGSLEDFDGLLEDAHRLGIRVLIDWVPNHSSDQHPWFQESLSGPGSSRRDWYYWRDGAGPGRPPNNWPATFLGGPAWTWDPRSRQWYLHTFLPQQPDLNWTNPAVIDAMQGTMRFWLDRGVDGFRVDVVHALGKDPALPDGDVRDGHVVVPITDRWSTHQILRDLRRLLDGYPEDRMMVGEVYILSTAKVAEYYGRGDELHLAFNFPPLYAPWEAAAWAQRIARVEEELTPRGAWPTWVLSNHDNPRHRTRYGSEARARAAAVLLLTLRGTPFLYAGEELGLEDAVVTGAAVRDPAGRDGCRAPIPWDDTPSHGWVANHPWLPWPPDPGARNAATLRADPGSILHLYRALLSARRASSALRAGSLSLRETVPGLVAYDRRLGDDRRLTVLNYTGRPLRAEPRPGSDPVWVVEISSAGVGRGEPWSGEVGADTALLLRPA